ncbi:MAG: alanine--tRNA ligase [Candidatus Magasanikbacteria bacterium CG11_big_fil_rev_8_21_14_0_20_39_34]|uniref:alanine--tRNA ligase n=1 Tax=Candidatus Magasanikbacteria bacterium CG11_big_fil_rev_8_21_14_0_20_39_34 TaxID=1974653 RepID=A0A2H0N5U8_9BACT|nr:MAG: alanine--tRNA ligase [Candidatus Magasanikbacteria bacterium CG11_big_fil_rev_8_21_14_0_20_39_34]
MKTNDIRQKYLEFFQKKQHEILTSASLLPENDPTTLFTGSGMQPMVPYLLGEKHPLGVRLADSQKCFRSGDIDEVGDNRHTTFFEMLGNWSLGDYFKEEQISWMWEFLTQELGLDPEHLYVTCFTGSEELSIPRDEESAHLWQKLFQERGIEAKIVENSEEEGMQGGRIFYYSEKKNWWSRSGIPQNMPEGEPGGPDTEMFWDFGEKLGLHEKSSWKDLPCHVNCDCGRFVEIGNNVFMQYKKTSSGFEQLVQKNVDFGGGLERVAAAVNNDPDIFTIDLFDGVRSTLEELSGKKYGEDEKDTFAFRVILDHMRAAVFLISDGAYPSNKDQGYFTRRLVRRAIQFSAHLDITENFVERCTRSIIETYQYAYPLLQEKLDEIVKVLKTEEEKFRKAIERAKKEYNKIEGEIQSLLEGTSNTENTELIYEKLAGICANLYQTHGLPFEIFVEFVEKLGFQIDEHKLSRAFEQEFKKHQELSRQGSEQKFKGGLSDHSDMSIKYHTATHLLHIALRKVLGDHVGQKGSNITPERLRFDFSHNDKLTEDQLKQVEDLVNAAIEKDYPVSFQEMKVEEAYKEGVIGMFPERYDDVVKVYTIGDPTHPGNANPEEPTFSREICGGPHVEHTGVLGHFTITKEESCSAGVRRIKAILE